MTELLYKKKKLEGHTFVHFPQIQFHP